MKNKGYTIVELIIIIVVLGLVTIATITSVSYAFEDTKISAYESEVEYLLKMAKVYGEEVKENITDSKHGITITVETLIEKGFVTANTDGKIVDPRKDNTYLNDLRIRITIVDEKIISEVVE